MIRSVLATFVVAIVVGTLGPSAVSSRPPDPTDRGFLDGDWQVSWAKIGTDPFTNHEIESWIWKFRGEDRYSGKATLSWVAPPREFTPPPGSGRYTTIYSLPSSPNMQGLQAIDIDSWPTDPFARRGVYLPNRGHEMSVLVKFALDRRDQERPRTIDPAPGYLTAKLIPAPAW